MPICFAFFLVLYPLQEWSTALLFTKIIVPEIRDDRSPLWWDLGSIRKKMLIFSLKIKFTSSLEWKWSLVLPDHRGDQRRSGLSSTLWPAARTVGSFPRLAGKNGKPEKHRKWWHLSLLLNAIQLLISHSDFMRNSHRLQKRNTKIMTDSISPSPGKSLQSCNINIRIVVWQVVIAELKSCFHKLQTGRFFIAGETGKNKRMQAWHGRKANVFQGSSPLLQEGGTAPEMHSLCYCAMFG